MMYFSTGMRQGRPITALLLSIYLVTQYSVVEGYQPVISGNNYLTENIETNFTCMTVTVKAEGQLEPNLFINWRLQSDIQENLSVNTYVIPWNATTTVRNSTIVFVPVADHHLKRLYCIVEELSGLKRNFTDSVILYVIHATTPTPDVPIATITKDQYLVSPGSQVIISCSIQSSLDITEIYWKKISNGNMDIYPNTNPNKYGITNDVLSSPKTSVLKINNIDNSNAGSYVCHAVPSSGDPGTSNTVRVNVVTFSLLSTQYTRAVQSSVTLDCTMTGTSGMNFEIRWYKNGQELVLSRDTRYVNGNQQIPSLTINNLQSTDSGKYTCQIRSGSDSLMSPEITLNVQSSAPEVTVSATPYVKNVGENINLACSFNQPVSSVFWTNTQTNQRYTTSPSTPDLLLNSLTAAHAGSYVCSGVSQASGLTGNSVPVSLVIIDTFQPQYSGQVGGEVTLNCNVNSPTTNYAVSWFKDGLNINIAGNPGKYEGGLISSPWLKIKSLTTSDTGVYYCRVTVNGQTSANSANINLQVTQSNPPSITVSTAPYIVNSGNSVRLTCTVNEAVSQVYWTKVGTGLRLTASPVSSTSWYVDLNQVTTSNAGSYVCNAVSSVSGLTGSSSAVSMVVIDSVQTQYSEKTGDNVTLMCNVNSPTNDYSVSWYKDGQSINIVGNPGKYEGGTVSSPSLKIKSLTTSDAGVYFCRVRFNDGTTKDSSNINLAVSQVNPPQVSIGRSTYIANIGDNVILGCSVNEAVSQVYWTNTLTNQIYTTSTSSPSLFFNSVTSANAGSYVCNAVSATTGLTGSSSPVNLIIIDPVQTQYSETVGGNVTLNCNINSPTTGYTVTWYKDGQSINIIGNPGKYEGGTVSSPSLKIKSLTTSDAGVYFCRVRFNDGTTKDSANINLAVSQGNPPQITISRSTYIANVGDNVILGCIVNEAVSQVYWTNTLTNQIYTTSTSSPSLIFNSVTSANAGSYVCNAISATTGLTGSSSLVNLIVIDSGSLQQYDKAVGDSIMLMCDVNPKSLSYSVSWYRNNAFLNIAGNPGKYGGGNTTHPSLEIKSLSAGDDGTYYCRVTYNVDGTSMNGANHQLSILSVAVQSMQYFANNGGTIKITCTSSTTDLIEVYWVRTLATNGIVQRLYSYTSSRYTGITKEDPSVTINSINTGDAGEYVCHVKSRSGAEANSGKVNVNVIRLDSTSYTHIPGTSESVILNVELAGPTTSEVNWFKNNLLMSIDGINYHNGNKIVPSLTIRSLTESDSGVYRFTAKNNGMLYTSPDIRLTIQQATAPQVSLPSSYIGSLGGYIILQCSVTPTTGLSSISWTLPSGSTDLSTPLNKYVGGTTSNPPLRIYSLSTTDSGVYTCRASNSAGTGSASTSLTVYKKPENVQITPTSLSVNNGDPIQLTCSGDGTPTQEYRWYKGSSLLNDFDSVYYVPSASASDGGSYTCNVSNQAGYNTDTMTVTVISTASQTYSKGEGESVTLDCSVSGLTSYAIKWYKDGQEITTRGTKYFNGDSRQPSLTINPLLSSDSGIYVCSVSGAGVSKNSSSINVFVGSKPVVSIPQSKYTGSIGGFVTIPCNVDPRNNLDEVKWFLNGVEIQVLAQPSKYQNGNRFFPDLAILQLNTGDNGFYRCSATNALGTGTSQQAELTVFSVNVPTNRYQPLEGQSVTLTCSTTLSSYSVTWYKNGEKITLPGSGYQNGRYPVPSLTISNVDVGDSGIYVCSITGGGFMKNGSSIEVSVQQQLVAPDIVMTFNPSSVSVRPGEPIQVSANAGGSPDPVYRWSKNGVVVYTGQTLIIESASSSNAGIYTVTASNSAGETNGTLTINVLTQEVTVSSNQYNALVGDSVVMGCTVQGVSNYIVTWYKDGQVLGRTSRHQDGDRNIPTLTITSIIAEDDGKYICSATNLNNGDSTNSSVITLTVGVIVLVKCVADGTSVVYQWTKGGVKLRENGLLYIQNTDRFDDGVYNCTAMNKGGNHPVITTTVSTVTTSVGLSVTLNCENDADPVATQYEWKYGDITQLLSSSSLSVDIVDDNSFIDYTCTAMNIHGSSEQHTFTLVKEGAGKLLSGASVRAVVGASVGAVVGTSIRAVVGTSIRAVVGTSIRAFVGAFCRGINHKLSIAEILAKESCCRDMNHRLSIAEILAKES
ncbi:hypothetical protein KUTeg_006410 [Tegillarca granosa]|uniref:Ig-like domain-containing protein n=1 Tax=Tegillarca granosa TaxID=220873 RepID=A0ABQ9FIC0_TEGGR|nr:hypothetical protein KUTeg_006410 [Tegillarca granosa]